MIFHFLSDTTLWRRRNLPRSDGHFTEMPSKLRRLSNLETTDQEAEPRTVSCIDLAASLLIAGLKATKYFPIQLPVCRGAPTSVYFVGVSVMLACDLKPNLLPGRHFMKIRGAIFLHLPDRGGRWFRKGQDPSMVIPNHGA